MKIFVAGMQPRMCAWLLSRRSTLRYVKTRGNVAGNPDAFRMCVIPSSLSFSRLKAAWMDPMKSLGVCFENSCRVKGTVSVDGSDEELREYVPWNNSESGKEHRLSPLVWRA